MKEEELAAAERRALLPQKRALLLSYVMYVFMHVCMYVYVCMVYVCVHVPPQRGGPCRSQSFK